MVLAPCIPDSFHCPGCRYWSHLPNNRPVCLTKSWLVSCQSMSLFGLFFFAPGSELFTYNEATSGASCSALALQLLIRSVRVVCRVDGLLRQQSCGCLTRVLPHFDPLQHTAAGMWKHPLQLQSAGGSQAKWSHGVWVWWRSRRNHKTTRFFLFFLNDTVLSSLSEVHSAAPDLRFHQLILNS